MKERCAVLGADVSGRWEAQPLLELLLDAFFDVPRLQNFLIVPGLVLVVVHNRDRQACS